VRDRSFSEAFYSKGVRNGYFRKFRLDKVLQVRLKENILLLERTYMEKLNCRK